MDSVLNMLIALVMLFDCDAVDISHDLENPDKVRAAKEAHIRLLGRYLSSLDPMQAERRLSKCLQMMPSARRFYKLYRRRATGEDNSRFTLVE